jgi:hypothetical protein
MDRSLPGQTEREGFAQAALQYLAAGWHPIPLVAQAKTPRISWKSYQMSAPNEQDISTWAKEWPDANVGLITGCNSRLLVLDADSDDGILALEPFDLPATPTVVTAKGAHYYFQMPAVPVPSRVRVLPDVDVRADRGYIVAPPSIHPSGVPYRWAEGLGPQDVPLAPVPERLLALLVASSVHPSLSMKGGGFACAVATVHEGARHRTAVSLIGYLLAKRVEPSIAATLVQCWNLHQCDPPLDEYELDGLIDDIAARELQKRKDKRREY